MKRFSIIIMICQIMLLSANSQNQQGISHQAVIRNSSNELVSNAPIGARISIIQSNPDGYIVYIESHSLLSNSNGLISFIIGQGIAIYGNFADIVWEQGPYYIRTEVDPLGDTNYSIISTSQVHSVPYSFISNQSLSLKLLDINGKQYQIVVDTLGNLHAQLIIGTPCPSKPTVTDIDNNVYNTLLFRDQCWMQENLKTTKYRNGTDIFYPGNNNVAWQNNLSGAYAWYNDDVSMKDKYGALYNWYAVNNSNGLCPDGWHVPSDEEWLQLASGNYGNQLKSCRQIGSPMGTDCNTSDHPRWNFHDVHFGTDESGFSGLPSGCRSEAGSYWYRGMRGYWWSTTEDYEFVWVHGLRYDYGSNNRSNEAKKFGYSIRCVSD